MAKDKNSSWGFVVDKESTARLNKLNDLNVEITKLKKEKDRLSKQIFEIDRQFNTYNALLSRLYMTTSSYMELSPLSLNLQIAGISHWSQQNQALMTVYIQSGLYYFSVTTSDGGVSTSVLI